MTQRKLSTITLYAATPFDQTYKHVVNWNSKKDLNEFLDQFAHVTENVSYQNLNKPIRWDTMKNYTVKSGGNDRQMQTTLNALTGFNYIKIHDVDHNGDTIDYYAFITNLEYYNDGTTFIYFSIDMWNTYFQMISWQNSNAMIQRGFVQEVSSDLNSYTPMFDKIKAMPDEIGGDGCEYLQESNEVGFHAYKNHPGAYVYDNQVKFVLFTAQPKDATKESGSLLGLYSEYLYYFIAYNPQNSHLYNISVNGKKISSRSKTTIEDAYKKLATVKEFAGTDSLVVDSEIYNYLGLPFEFQDGNILNFTGKNLKLEEKSDYLIKINYNPLTSFKPESGFCSYGENSKIPSTESVLKSLCNFYYTKYGQDCPLKIMMQPFSKLYFTDGKGTALTANIAEFTNLKVQNISLKRYGAISENGHETYALNHYNRAATSDQSKYVTYENALAIDDSARDTPIILDNYTMYLNANRNQLANTRANAKMNLQLAKQGNLISLQNTQRSINNSLNTTAYQADRGVKKSFIGLGLGAVTGAANGLIHGGGPAGAGKGAIAGVVGGVGGVVNSFYDRNTANTVAGMNAATNAANARANFAYANEVATNNYEQTIRSQNAMLADVRNHNDQIAHQGSNYLVSYQNGNVAFHWQLFTCQEAVMQNAILYFKLFGYEVNQYGRIDPWLKVKNHFNYVRTSNCHLAGTLPTEAQTTLATMLDNGTTFWTDNPDSLVKFTNRDQTNNIFRSDNPFQ